MKYSILVVILVYMAASCYGSYSPPMFYDMVGNSDLIVYGEIVKINEAPVEKTPVSEEETISENNEEESIIVDLDKWPEILEYTGRGTYELKVIKKLVGEEKADVVEVYQLSTNENSYIEISCCSDRWASYKTGQKMIAFMNLDNEDKESSNRIYRLRSAGPEGEFPVEGEFVYCFGMGIRGMPYVKYGNLHAQKVLLKDMISAIEEYGDYYEVITEPNRGSIDKINMTCTYKELGVYDAKSKVHDWLVRTTMGSYVFRKQ